MVKKVNDLKFNSAIPDEKIKEIMNSKGGSEVQEFLKAKGKVRISTMLDTDILEELKRRARAEGDGRYQTFLNQLLRETMFEPSKDLDKGKIAEVIKSLVKPSALKRKQA